MDYFSVSRSVIFKSDDEHSYWRKGSSFLIASPNNHYWITASHVLENTRGCVESLRIYPSDNSQISLPFNEKYTINKGLTDDEDYKDIFMLRVNLDEFDKFADAPLAAMDIEQGVWPAEQLKVGDELWIAGYPSESNSIDYDKREIKNTRSVLRAIYKGASVCDYCHELMVESSIILKDYDGLSGSPVFYLKKLDRNAQEPLLVGMLLRGSASSRIAHFVSSSVIADVVNFVENNA